MKLGKTIKVFSDGKHNGMTDLKKMNGVYFLTFRKASGHVVRDGNIMVYASNNGKHWRDTGFINIPRMDNRDPHLFYYKREPALIFVTYNPKTDRVTSHISYMGDYGWTKPKIFKKDFVAWRPIWHRDKLFIPGFYHGKQVKMDATKYGCPFQKYGSRVYVDGRLEKISKEKYSNEVELFEYKKALYAICRIEGKHAKLYRRIGRKWIEKGSFSSVLQGPCVKVINGRIFVVARDTAFEHNFIEGIKNIFEWVYLMEFSLVDGKFIEKIEVIRGINLDSGYAALEETKDKGRFLMSFYAGNHFKSAVFVQEVFI